MQKNEKTFDAVRLMREIREELSRELEGKSFEEIERHIQERAQLSERPSRSSAA
jgi:hypothetical protein